MARMKYAAATLVAAARVVHRLTVPCVVLAPSRAGRRPASES